MTKRYRVIALMGDQLTQLVVSDGPDPYSTSVLAMAERVLREVSALSPAYVSPRVEEFLPSPQVTRPASNSEAK